MKANAELRNSTTSSGGRLRAFAVKLRMSRNITQISRVSPAKSAGLSSRRSTTAGETCCPKRLVTRSREAASATADRNLLRNRIATRPATTPAASMIAALVR
jgi:hypothetical protein